MKVTTNQSLDSKSGTASSSCLTIGTPSIDLNLNPPSPNPSSTQHNLSQLRLPTNPVSLRPSLQRSFAKSNCSIGFASASQLPRLTQLSPKMSPTRSQASSIRSGSNSKSHLSFQSLNFNPMTTTKLQHQIMAKNWAQQKNRLKSQLKRMEFIIRKWEEIDVERQQQERAEQQNRMFYEEEISGLREALRVSEQEKEDMMRDMQDLDRELRKIQKIENNYTFGDYNRCSNSPRNHNPNNILTHPTVLTLLNNHQLQLQQLTTHYQTLLTEKQLSYTQLIKDFQNLESELQQQRQDTMRLLQKRTNEVEENLTNLKLANEEINAELKAVIERAQGDLEEEKEKVRQLEGVIEEREREVEEREEIIGSLKNQVMLLHQELAEMRSQFGMIRSFQSVLDDPQTTSPEMITTDSQTTHELSSTLTPQPNHSHSGSQTTADRPMLFDQYSQVDIENSIHKGKTETLHKEIELLKKKVMNLSGRLEEKEMEVESLRQRVGREEVEEEDEGDREEGGQGVEAWVKKCSELVIENNRLQTMLLKDNSDSDTDNNRIRVLLKDIPQNDLKSIANPSIVQQLSQLRLFRLAASTQIQRLKNQLQDSMRTLQTYIDNSNPSNNPPQPCNHQITINNLQHQVTTLQAKLEGLQTRYDIKQKELKEKDTFVKNVIVNRVGKEVGLSEMQYVLGKLEEFVGKSYGNS